MRTGVRFAIAYLTQPSRRAPVFHEMCDITLASDDRSALVSFENKVRRQAYCGNLTFIDPVPDSSTAMAVLRQEHAPTLPPTHIHAAHTYDLRGAPQHLRRHPRRAHSACRHRFVPLHPIFPQSLSLLNIQLRPAGDINIWDRETTAFLYAIQMPAHIGHLTALAWNHGAEEWMFATGTHDGRVFLWTIQDEKRRDEDAKKRASSRSESYSRSPASASASQTLALSPLQTARRASAGSRSVSVLMAGRRQTDSPVGMSPTTSPPRRSGTSTSYGSVYISDSDVEDGDRSSLGDVGDDATVDDSHGRRRGTPARTSF